jgi:hypothetical protein
MAELLDADPEKASNGRIHEELDFESLFQSYGFLTRDIDWKYSLALMVPILPISYLLTLLLDPQ